MSTDIPAADVSPVTPAGALVLEPPILRARRGGRAPPLAAGDFPLLDVVPR